jgi:Protein of unknown function (DUF4239)
LTAIWLVVCGAWAVGTRRLMRRALTEAERTRAAAIAGPLMPALGAAFALLAALSLAGTASELRATEDQVSGEAAQASRLAWSVTGPGMDTAGLQTALLTYLQSTRATEWSSPDAGGDEETMSVLAELERRTRESAAASDITTPHATELLNSLDGITSARRQRLAASHHDLPVFYIAVVAVAGLALIANASALTLNDTRRLTYLPAGLVAVVGLAMALLLAIGSPFNGAFVASGDPIDQVIVGLRSGLFHV